MRRLEIFKGPLLVMAAGACWGLISLFVRPMAAAGLASIEAMFVRNLLAATLMITWLALRKKGELRIKLKDSWIFIGAGVISIALFGVVYYASINSTSVGVSVILLYTSPIWVMVLSALLFKEKVTKKKITALVLAFCGVVLVSGVVGGAMTISITALGLGLLSGFTYSTYTIFSYYALFKYGARTIIAYIFLVGTIVLIPFTDFASLIDTVVINPKVLAYAGGFASIATVVPFVLYTTGLSHMDASRAAVLVCVEPVVGTLVGVFVFGECLGLLSICGIVLVLVSVIILNLRY